MKYVLKNNFCMIVIFVCIILVSIIGCKKEDKEGTLGVALICSAAGPNDNGYNQSAIVGLEKAKKEFGINSKVVETSDVPGAITQLAQSDYKVIFSLEYNFDALIDGVGGNKPIAEQYPDTTFIVFNDNPNVDASGNAKHKNVISVIFDVHEASFIAGALSVYVNENAEKLFGDSYQFTKANDGRKVAFIGGTKSNGITVFSYGFLQGINYIAKELGVNYKFYSDYNAGFSDSAAGAAKANTYYMDGVNIVYTVAGSVGDGITSKAKEVKKLAIEVDANKDANQSGYILTSVLKNTDVPVYKIVKSYKDGTILELSGKATSYDLSSGATGITSLSEIEKYIVADSKAIWEDIKSKLGLIAEKISNKEIEVVNAQSGEKLNKANLQNINMLNE